MECSRLLSKSAKIALDQETGCSTIVSLSQYCIFLYHNLKPRGELSLNRHRASQRLCIYNNNSSTNSDHECVQEDRCT